MENNLISLKEMARKLSVHPTTLRSWAKSGEVPYHRIGKKYFFDINNIKEYSLNKGDNKISSHRFMVSNGYLYLYIGKNQMSNKNGYVAVHRLLMQAKLGRLLEEGEIVHMKNGNTLDLNLDNLEVVKTLGEHNANMNFSKDDRRT